MQKITIVFVAEKYISESILRPETAKNYLDIALVFERNNGAIPIDELGRDHFLQWRKDVLARASEVSWNTYLRHIRVLLNFAFKQGLISELPVDKSLFVKSHKKRKKTVKPSTIRKAIFFLMDPETPLIPGWFWKSVILTLYYTAMRRSQLTALQWRDINLDERCIYFRSEGSKTHEEWEIPISLCLVGELTTLLEKTVSSVGTQPPFLQNEQVFKITRFNSRYSGEKLAPEQITRFFQRLQKHIDEPISAHMLRHTSATNMANMDSDGEATTRLRVVQQILGHSSITTTAQYLHPKCNQMRETLAGLPEI